MSVQPGEGTPTPVPVPGNTDYLKADGALENPVEGPAGGYSEEQDLAPEGSWAVSNKALTSNVATLTIPTGHGILVGNTVIVTDVDATFNGTWVVTAVTATTISYACTAANVTSTPTTSGLVLPGEINLGYEPPELLPPQQPAANQALPNTDPGITG